MTYVAKCDVCGVIKRGDFEEVGDTAEDHDQFHDVRIQRVATDGSGHVCEACGETFRTLTRLRLHEKDDCPERQTYDQIDPDAANADLQAAEGLLTCRSCGQENPNADFEETPSFADGDYHLIVEFDCRHCGFENENRVVMEGVDREDLGRLPAHLRPDEADGGSAEWPERAQQLDDGTVLPALDEDEWDPEPAELRDGETTDIDSHARRNAEQLRMAEEDLKDDDDLVTDGGRDQDDTGFFVVNEDRGAVVAGPFDVKKTAAEKALDRGPSHIVATEAVLEMIEVTSSTTIRWENEDVDVVTDGGQDIRSEWTLVCTDCDFEDDLVTEGHPREGPPSEVEDRVREHKGTVDWSHVVRVEGRVADEDREIDPSLLTDGGQSVDDTERSLEERIREKLLVEDPDESSLVNALEGAIEIVEGSWLIRLKDDINQRDPKDQVFTYLLGKYAAARVSDGEVSMSSRREELYEHFDRKLVKEACEHGWIRHWDGQVQIRPRHYKHTAVELAARYADRSHD